MFEFHQKADAEGRQAEAKVWTVLIAQIWAGLPSYCWAPVDLQKVGLKRHTVLNHIQPCHLPITLLRTLPFISYPPNSDLASVRSLIHLESDLPHLLRN